MIERTRTLGKEGQHVGQHPTGAGCLLAVLSVVVALGATTLGLVVLPAYHVRISGMIAFIIIATGFGIAAGFFAIGSVLLGFLRIQVWKDGALADDQPARAAPPRVAETLGTASGEILPGRVRYFGDYELLEEISRAGTGVVYKARQVSLNRLVALKMTLTGKCALAPDIQRFRDEARPVYLDHPHIVPIYEEGEHDGQHFRSMKLIDGPSLAQTLFRDQWPVASTEGQRQTAALLETVARAVHHAHQRGILHCDLKPSHILLDANRQPHVTDFGRSRKVGADNGLTHSDAIVGRPSYLAPEQVRGERTLTTATDIYALGAILYQLLTGRQPFQGASGLEMLRLLQESEPERPRTLQPELDRDLESICLKCLAKEPARRYDSAEALAEDLRRWQAGEPIVLWPASSAWERTAKWAKRRPALAGLLSVILLSLAILLVGLVVVTILA